MSAAISNKKLLICYSLLVLVMLFVIGLTLWGFHVSTCFSLWARQEPSTSKQTANNNVLLILYSCVRNSVLNVYGLNFQGNFASAGSSAYVRTSTVTL